MTALERHAAQDARRGALLVVADVPETASALASGFAMDGYDAVVAPSRELSGSGADLNVRTLLSGLARPVFALSVGRVGSAIWSIAAEGGLAAISVCDAPWRELTGTPACPALLHLSWRAAEPSSAPIWAWKDHLPLVGLHIYAAEPGFFSQAWFKASPDAARLARLRTLQLFHRAAGGREAGG